MKRHDIATRVDADRRYLENYDIERRSVFIGRLPSDVHSEELEKEIRSVMSEAGEVKAVTVIIKPPNQGKSDLKTDYDTQKLNRPERHTAVAFAFCEFTTTHMAINAVETMVSLASCLFLDVYFR